MRIRFSEIGAKGACFRMAVAAGSAIGGELVTAEEFFTTNNGGIVRGIFGFVIGRA